MLHRDLQLDDDEKLCAPRGVRNYTFILVLDDILERGGEIEIYPTTLATPCTRENPYRYVRRQKHDVHTISGVGAGTLIVFDSLLLHRSLRNWLPEEKRRLSWYFEGRRNAW